LICPVQAQIGETTKDTMKYEEQLKNGFPLRFFVPLVLAEPLAFAFL
jgi:hypothetical protein